MGQIQRYVVTGAPLSGKTTVLSGVLSDFSKQGVSVLPEPESATMLLKTLAEGGNGIPGVDIEWSQEWQENFQKRVIESQQRESEWSEQIAAATSVPMVSISDRGILDIYGFVDEKTADSILEGAGLTREGELSKLAGVFHLTTLAWSDKQKYLELQRSTNAGRFHDPQQAREIDKNLLMAYDSHPRYVLFEGTEQSDPELRKREITKEVAVEYKNTLESFAASREEPYLKIVAGNEIEKLKAVISRRPRAEHLNEPDKQEFSPWKPPLR